MLLGPGNDLGAAVRGEVVEDEIEPCGPRVSRADVPESSTSLHRLRRYLRVVGIFSALALLLAVVGVFHITETQAEAKVEPDRVSDDVWRESITVVAGYGAGHAATLLLSTST